MKKLVTKILKFSLYDFLMYLNHLLKRKRYKAHKIINNYLRTDRQCKLQIGCGEHFIESWLNTDLNPVSDKIAFLDAGEKFPFKENTFDFIFSEHIFEHLQFKESCNFISECFRVLKPNGTVRLAIPHIDFLFKIYQDPELPIHKEYVKWATENFCKDIADFFPEENYSEIYVINNFYRDWGHQVLHSYDSLKKLFLSFNFFDIQKKEVGISDFEELSNLEKHSTTIPDKFNRLETLIIEARKPAASL